MEQYKVSYYNKKPRIFCTLAEIWEDEETRQDIKSCQVTRIIHLINEGYIGQVDVGCFLAEMNKL